MRHVANLLEGSPTPKGYVWGVFKQFPGDEGPAFYADNYFHEMNYPTLVKGNLTQAEAEKLAAEMLAKKESRDRRTADRIVEQLLEQIPPSDWWTCEKCGGKFRQLGGGVPDVKICAACKGEQDEIRYQNDRRKEREKEKP